MVDLTAPEFKRYAAVHQKPQGAGDSRPTALQIIRDEGLEGKFYLCNLQRSGRVTANHLQVNLMAKLVRVLLSISPQKYTNMILYAVLITGCSSGIGIETARAMKATGAHVFATARDLNKGKKALGESKCSPTDSNVEIFAYSLRS